MLVALAQCVVEKVTLALVLDASGASVACDRCDFVNTPLRDEDAVTVWVTETAEEIENQEAVDDFEEVLDGVSVKAPVMERRIVLETHPEGDCETDGDRVALFLGDFEGLPVLDTVTEAVDDADWVAAAESVTCELNVTFADADLILRVAEPVRDALVTETRGEFDAFTETVAFCDDVDEPTLVTLTLDDSDDVISGVTDLVLRDDADTGTLTVHTAETVAKLDGVASGRDVTETFTEKVPLIPLADAVAEAMTEAELAADSEFPMVAVNDNRLDLDSDAVLVLETSGVTVRVARAEKEDDVDTERERVGDTVRDGDTDDESVRDERGLELAAGETVESALVVTDPVPLLQAVADRLGEPDVESEMRPLTEPLGERDVVGDLVFRATDAVIGGDTVQIDDGVPVGEMVFDRKDVRDCVLVIPGDLVEDAEPLSVSVLPDDTEALEEAERLDDAEDEGVTLDDREPEELARGDLDTLEEPVTVTVRRFVTERTGDEDADPEARGDLLTDGEPVLVLLIEGVFVDVDDAVTVEEAAAVRVDVCVGALVRDSAADKVDVFVFVDEGVEAADIVVVFVFVDV